MHMKTSLLLYLLLPSFLAAQNRNGEKVVKQEHAASDKEEITKVEMRWAQAEDLYDAKVLNDILGEGFVSMNEFGELKNKAQEIASDADWKAPGSQVIDELSIRVDGDSAIALGRFTFTDRNSGRVVRQGRFVDTLLRRNGRWQVIANSYVRTDVNCRQDSLPSH